jgi:hypothetical protein
MPLHPRTLIHPARKPAANSVSRAILTRGPRIQTQNVYTNIYQYNTTAELARTPAWRTAGAGSRSTWHERIPLKKP